MKEYRLTEDNMIRFMKDIYKLSDYNIDSHNVINNDIYVEYHIHDIITGSVFIENIGVEITESNDDNICIRIYNKSKEDETNLIIKSGTDIEVLYDERGLYVGRYNDESFYMLITNLYQVNNLIEEEDL